MSCGRSCRVASRKCERCSLNRQERFFSGPRGRICLTCQKKARRKSSHASRVQKTYGLESGEYGVLFESQGRACAICRGTRTRNLDVDHCHKTGLVRGLLCARCNRTLLGRGLRDSAQVARSAAEYLDDPPAPRIIGERWHSSDGGNSPR
ncbi:MULTISPECIES: endonuclease domain-containing protein [Streptomyces]